MKDLMKNELVQVSGGDITITIDPDFDWSKLIGTPGKKPTDPVIIIPKPPVYDK
ncbi:hypothetical protein JQC92_14270 [Shewanella sp. 202IG2-18]|uniref:hypothetical protein n=1 Tax=Parashewanella hymeniacidonis TaxID=2807618 RepID=UPI00195F36AD|nr:hypothetical protein [Parashewanella hymeniacidonis]MBM7073178.1 hypothetical protein [Parashewanella hymeniacidonis]